MHGFVIFIALAIVVLWGSLAGGALPKAFSMRACQGRAWRRAFSEASKEEIREFLSLFMSAFAFRDKDRLLLHPEDQILAIYKALYPHQWTPDALELETFAADLQHRYGLSLEALWHESLSLRDVFKSIRSHQAGSSL